jgi:aspartyl-tRNA(Asn)/glutamyl-tRNA(Gln) amidotransferase subunit A
MTRRAPLTLSDIEAALARAEAAQEALRCWIDLDPAGARAAAGASGPLQGLTGAIKGNIAVRGLANTGGSAARRAAVAGADAGVVRRLREAGACLLGTANLHEGALGATTRNEAFGWCQNPRRAGHTPGGSSGGSGAAVAAGLVDFALGTDTMGSIRIPAAYCGVFGFKPGGSWLAQDGVIPLKASFDQVGPLARDADTLVAVALALGAPQPQPVAGCRLGVLEGWEAVPEAIAAAIAPALDQLERAGAQLVPVRLPGDLAPADLLLAGFILCAREAADVHWAAEMADPGSGLSPGFRFLMDYGRKADPARLAAAGAMVAQAAGAVRGLLAAQGLDGIVSPTAPETAFADTLEAPRQAGFTGLANFADLPSVSVPAGAVDGLPVGLMLTAGPGRDGLALGFAQLFDPWHRTA